jgi:hypothetical protein
MLLGALSLIGWAVALLVSTARAVMRKNWKRSALLPCALVVALPLIFLGIFSGDYVHLAVMYPYYVIEIRSHPDWQSKEVRFYWGDDAVSALDGIRARTLIYDASGNIVVGDRPDRGGDGIKVNIQPFIGNFYLELSYTA